MTEVLVLEWKNIMRNAEEKMTSKTCSYIVFKMEKSPPKSFQIINVHNIFCSFDASLGDQSFYTAYDLVSR